MEKKKLKLSISGSTNKTINSIEQAKNQSKNTRFVEIAETIRKQNHQFFNSLQTTVIPVSCPFVDYPEAKMAIPHDIVCCVGEKTVHNPQKLRFPEKNYYLHLPEEMEELFSDVPDALENTRKIAAHEYAVYENICLIYFKKWSASLRFFEIPFNSF